MTETIERETLHDMAAQVRRSGFDCHFRDTDGALEIVANKRIVVVLDIQSGEWHSPVCGETGTAENVSDAIAFARMIAKRFIGQPAEAPAKRGGKQPRKTCSNCQKSRAVCHYRDGNSECDFCKPLDRHDNPHESFADYRRRVEEFAAEAEACGFKFAISKSGAWMLYDEDGEQRLWWLPKTGKTFINGREQAKCSDPLELIEDVI